jgi:cation diffusion facilitator CzcD-associated flavoprotein CzcO
MTLDLDVAIIGAGLCGICPLRHAGVARPAARRRDLLRHGGAGSPNFFLMHGPNTNLGHNSIIFMIECQAAFILRCLRRLLDGAGSLEVEAEATARYQARLEREIAGTGLGGGLPELVQDRGRQGHQQLVGLYAAILVAHAAAKAGRLSRGMRSTLSAATMGW